MAMELGKIRALLDCQELELRRLRSDHRDLKTEVNALRRCLRNSGVLHDDSYAAEMVTCWHSDHQAELGSSKLAGGTHARSQLQEKPAACMPSPLPWLSEQVLPTIQEDCRGAPTSRDSDCVSTSLRGATVEHSTLADTSIAVTQYGSEPSESMLDWTDSIASLGFDSQKGCWVPFPMENLGHDTSAERVDLHSSPPIKLGRESSNERKVFSGASKELPGLPYAATRPGHATSRGETRSATNPDTSASLFTVGAGDSLRSSLEMPQASGSRGERDLADVKSRVYRASFAAKLHDITMEAASNVQMEIRSLRESAPSHSVLESFGVAGGNYIAKDADRPPKHLHAR